MSAYILNQTVTFPQTHIWTLQWRKRGCIPPYQCGIICILSIVHFLGSLFPNKQDHTVPSRPFCLLMVFDPDCPSAEVQHAVVLHCIRNGLCCSGHNFCCKDPTKLGWNFIIPSSLFQDLLGSFHAASVHLRNIFSEVFWIRLILSCCNNYLQSIKA